MLTTIMAMTVSVRAVSGRVRIGLERRAMILGLLRRAEMCTGVVAMRMPFVCPAMLLVEP